LGHADPELAQRFLALKKDFEAETGRELHVTSVWRSAEAQHALYQKGRALQADGRWRVVDPDAVVTQLDGTTRRSRHNVYPSQAVDVCVDTDPGPGKHVVWDHAAYAPLGPLATRHGLVWGGSWTRFKDAPHLELPA
jgi:hypothetical protein